MIQHADPHTRAVSSPRPVCGNCVPLVAFLWLPFMLGYHSQHPQVLLCLPVRSAARKWTDAAEKYKYGEGEWPAHVVWCCQSWNHAYVSTLMQSLPCCSGVRAPRMYLLCTLEWELRKSHSSRPQGMQDGAVFSLSAHTLELQSLPIPLPALHLPAWYHGSAQHSLTSDTSYAKWGCE